MPPTSTALVHQDHPEFVPGYEFLLTTAAKWHTADAEGEHRFVLRCRVTGTDPAGFDHEVVEVVSEEDPPPPAIRRHAPHAGSVAWFAIAPYLGSGKIATVPA